MTDDDHSPLSYAQSGVDIERGNRLVECIKDSARSTHREGVVGAIGGFGALFELPTERYQHPILVSGTDGVGTKLRLAIDCQEHRTPGIDLVAMCVNDVLTVGAEPLFFLDYYATGRLDDEVAARVIEGIAEGCRLSGAALIGGETAEMPGMYAAHDYDLAGFCVGVVERDQIINGEQVHCGDQILGLAASGAHSNGYSLIRRVLERDVKALQQPFDGDRTLADVLLAPTRIYVQSLLQVLRSTDAVRALAHITGGGLLENVPRVLPAGRRARIQRSAWPRPALFQWLQEVGRIEDAEMLRTFNCGIGMVVVVAAEHADAVAHRLTGCGESVFHIGVIESHDGPPSIIIE